MNERPLVYIAAPWVCKEKAAEAANLFGDAGFTVTEPWWSHTDVKAAYSDKVSDRDVEELEKQAVADFDGILRAELFVLLNLAKSEGKAVETGIALELSLPIILVGKPSNIFHYLPEITIVDDIQEALEVAKRECGL